MVQDAPHVQHTKPNGNLFSNADSINRSPYNITYTF